MSTKEGVNKLVDLTKFRETVTRLNTNLETLRVEVIALLHNKESLQRENTYLRELLNGG